MKSNKIYIIQMHTHTMPSRLIKLFTHYKYSHIAISLTPECDKKLKALIRKESRFAAFKRCYIRENEIKYIALVEKN